MFVTAQDFKKTPYKIPNLDDAEIGADFAAFVTEKEDEVLPEILGPDLYAEFTAGLLEDPVPVKWTRLRDGHVTIDEGRKYVWGGLKKLLKPYIYSLWVKHRTTDFAGEGIVVVENESATQVSSDQGIVDAYNKFVDQVGYAFDLRYGNNLYTFIEFNEVDYPSIEYSETYLYGLDKMNFLDL